MENKKLRRIMNRITAIVACFMMVFSQPALATITTMPDGTVLVEGQNTVDVDSLNYGAGTTTNYQGVGDGASLIYNVTGGSATHIDGTINVWNLIFAILNSSGINIGSTGALNVHANAAALLSTLNMNSVIRDAIQNKTFYSLVKDASKGNGLILNRGHLTVGEGGSLTLAGGSVLNEGSIVAKLGKVNLAAGEKMVLELDDTGTMSVVVEDAVTTNDNGLKAAVDNMGTIIADGGQVILEAKVVKGIFQNAVNTEGLVQADSVETKNGEIYITANDRVRVGGTVSAEGGIVKVDSEGADYDGVIKSATADLNAHGGDTFINGTFASNQTTISDDINIFVTGDYIVTGNITINADADNDGIGYFSQDKGTKISATGNMDITGADVYVNNVFFGGNLNNHFNATATHGEIKVGNYTDRLGQAVGDGRIISAVSGLQNYTATTTNAGFINEALTNSADASGNKFQVDDLTGAQKWGWVEFSLSDPALQDVFVETGTMTLTSSGNSKDVTVGIYHSLNDWTGDGAHTWNNQPSISATSLGGGKIAKNNDPVTVDFGNTLQGELISSANLATLFVKSDAAVEFWNQSAPDNKDKPVLNISYYKLGQGNISLTANGNGAAKNDITLGKLITKGNVIMDAVQGAIVDANGANLNVIASNLIAEAAKGIVTNAAVKNLSAKNKTSGDIFIKTNGAVTVADLDGFGGLINNAVGGKIRLDSDNNITLDAAVTSTEGDISLNATGNIRQTANGDVIINQIDSSLLNAPLPTVQTDDGHLTGQWQAGISNDPTINVRWTLPSADAAAAEYTATAGGTYSMDVGSSIETNGGAVTITADGDIKIAKISAGNAVVSLTSATGSILDNEPALSRNIYARNILQSVATGKSTLSASRLSHPEGINFSYLWNSGPVSPDNSSETYNSLYDTLTGGWIFTPTTTPTLGNGQNWFFNVATLKGLSKSATGSLGSFWIDVTNPNVSAALSGLTFGLNGWYTGDVTATGTATDALSGLDTLSYRASSDGGATWSGWITTTSSPQQVLTTLDGTGYKVEFRAVDKAGNSASALTETFKIDKTAPLVSAALSGTFGLNDWYVSNVTATGTASDATSGLGWLHYRTSTDGGATWSSWTSSTGSPLEVIKTLDGTGYKVEFLALDKAGNHASAFTQTFKIDQTAPDVSAAITAGTLGLGGWYTSDVTSTGSATDGVSGIGLFEYSTDGGATWTVGANPKDVISSLEGSGQSVIFRATNGAGLTNTASTTFKIDQTAPDVTAVLSGEMGLNDWYVSDVTVTGEASDEMSGLKTFKYRTYDGSEWSEWTLATGNPQDVVTSADGRGYKVEFKAVDMAGNSETIETDRFKIDQTAPDVTAVLSGDEGLNNWYVSDVTATGEASDEMSGLKTFKYRTYDGSEWSEWTLATGNPQDVVTSADGRGYKVEFKAVDMAGNSETIETDRFKIDQTAPDVTAVLSGDEGLNNWYVSDVTVTGEASDEMSGLKTFKYRTYDGSEWSEWTLATGNPQDVVTSADGRGYKVEFKAVDMAGNKGKVTTDRFKIDQTAPTVTATIVTNGGIPNGPGGSFFPPVDSESTATDATSGIDALTYEYSIDGLLWLPYTSPNDISVSTLGPNTVQFRVSDRAGNIGLNLAAFTISSPVLPTAAATVAPNAAGFLADELRFRMPGLNEIRDYQISQTQGPATFTANEVYFYHPVFEMSMYEMPAMGPDMYQFIDGNVTLSNPALFPVMLDDQKRKGLNPPA